MSCLGICILLLASGVAFSEKYCLSENPCKCVQPDKTVIDLSTVGFREYPRFQDVSFTANNCSGLYSYNPCFPFNSPEKHTITDPNHKACAGAAACVKGTGGPDGVPPEEHAIGLQNTAVFEQIKGELSIKYTVTGSPIVLKVNLKCTNGSDLHILTMDECPDSANPIVLTLSSQCACPNGCVKAPPNESSSEGLSTGSKLLIAFFTILLAYLIIGVVWNYCNGSQGIELIPNIEFWNGLPTLIMEGVVFTCSCCGRQSSYGEV